MGVVLSLISREGTLALHRVGVLGLVHTPKLTVQP